MSYFKAKMGCTKFDCCPRPRWGRSQRSPRSPSRVANFREMKFGTPRSRRRRRRGEWGGGIPLPSRLGGLGERRELPQQSPGWSPGRKLGILWDLYIGLFDRYRTLTGKIAGPVQKRQESQVIWTHFQVSRVSCESSKGLKLRTRPVSLGIQDIYT